MIARARALVIARRALTSHEADWACDQSARGGCEVAVIVSLPLASDIQLALDRLKSLHDGDIGVLEIVACGRRAIPALRALLLEGESSGIYHPRCRAVEALSALGAHDVLIEFLGSPREMADPVNRTGEEVVISAAARALTNSSDERVFPLLLELAERQPLAGVIDALGSFRRSEATPSLIKALSEDYSRRAGEIALLQMGSRARAALLMAASRPAPSAEWEAQTSLRARRSAVQLLARIGVPSRQRSRLRALMEDADPEVRVHACRAYLASAPEEEKPEAIQRLVELLPRLGWLLCEEVEECILDHLESARAIMAERMREQSPDPTDQSPEARIYRSLFRVAQRAGSVSH